MLARLPALLFGLFACAPKQHTQPASVTVRDTLLSCLTGHPMKPLPPDSQALSALDTAGSALLSNPRTSTLVSDELGAKSRPLNADTIFVYSAEGDSTWMFTGTPIDSLYRPPFRAFYQELVWMHGDSLLLATYCVRIDSTHIGFLLRAPGMYSSSAVDLWVYDQLHHHFQPPVRIAEGWGDAGDVYDQIGWLVDLDDDHRRDLLQRVYGSSPDDGTGKLRHEEQFVQFRLWAGSGFAAPRASASTDSLLAHAFNPERWWPQRGRTP
jgi:hypothetical protein